MVTCLSNTWAWSHNIGAYDGRTWPKQDMSLQDLTPVIATLVMLAIGHKAVTGSTYIQYLCVQQITTAACVMVTQ